MLWVQVQIKLKDKYFEWNWLFLKMEGMANASEFEEKG